MSADIINLRRLRKRKARARKAEQAARNRLRFARSRAGKSLLDAEREKAARDLDGHRRDRD